MNDAEIYGSSIVLGQTDNTMGARQMVQPSAHHVSLHRGPFDKSLSLSPSPLPLPSPRCGVPSPSSAAALVSSSTLPLLYPIFARTPIAVLFAWLTPTPALPPLPNPSQPLLLSPLPREQGSRLFTSHLSPGKTLGSGLNLASCLVDGSGRGRGRGADGASDRIDALGRLL